MSSRTPSQIAFSPKTPQNAKLAAPISSASTGAASNLSRESATSSQQPGFSSGSKQPTRREYDYGHAAMRLVGKSTAPNVRSKVRGKAKSVSARPAKPNSKIGASALKRQPWSVPPTSNAAGANSPPLAPGMGGQR